MYVLQVYSVNGGGVWCRWNQCNGFVEILISFWHGCSPFKLRNLVSCPPALLKCCWLFVALITSQTFFFPPWLWRHTKQPKYHVVFCARCFHGPKLSSTGVILNLSVRDGKVILACTLASDSPVSLGCGWVMSACWGQPQRLGARMFLLFERQWCISHEMLLALFPWGGLSGVWCCWCSTEHTCCGKVFLWGGSHRWAPAGAGVGVSLV